jgi:transcriptional regulator with XRE-family HTH domain
VANLSASDIAGRRIREARQRRGWTAKELADRCADLGAPRVTATVVTNLETRRRATREISLEEVLILAHVLQVPPIHLMAPLDAGEKLEIVPGDTLGPVDAIQWIADDLGPSRSTVIGSHDAEDTNVLMRWAESDDVTVTLRQIGYVAMYIRAYDELVAEGSVTPGEAAAAAKSVSVLADRLMHFRARVKAQGYEPLPQDDIGEILRRRGLPSTLEEWRAQGDGPGILRAPDGQGRRRGAS